MSGRDVCVQTNHLKLISDDVLVEWARTGDDSAYVELCQRHSGMAMRVVNRIVRNMEDTEDVLQEAILKAFRNLDGFDGRSKFSTWFTKIAVNSALMLLRKRKRRPAQSLQDFSREMGGEAIVFPDGMPSPETLVMQSQLSRQLRLAIRRLPPILREVTEMRSTGDYSVEEISGMVGLSVPATKSRLLRARKVLAKTLVSRPASQQEFARS